VSSINHVRMCPLPFEFAENGDLVFIEGMKHVPFLIARVFMVRGKAGAIRGKHAHRKCSQFMICTYGSVEITCDDGLQTVTYTLSKPDIGLLVPSGIWAQQSYISDQSVLTVLCDRKYESEDYIRNYDEFKIYTQPPPLES
jgi:dTDP-4-dehydrorhamnose 3,5-epimerase-like enzyme